MSGDPDHDGLGQLLLQAFWWLDRRAAAQLERSGVEISAAQALTLTRIPADGVRPVELARLTGVSRQAVHQTLNDLEEAGHVRRVRLGGGAVTVRLTEAGERTAEAVADAEREAEEAAGARIGADRVDALRDALGADWGEPG